MNYNIKGTGLAISPELREYTEKKLASADKFLMGDSVAHANVELEFSQLRDGGKYKAEFTVSASGASYRAEHWGTSMHEAIDIAIGELLKELRREKQKHIHLVRRGAAKIKDMIRGFRR